MDIDLLRTISRAVIENREVKVVLRMIVAGLVEEAEYALARIWLLVPAAGGTGPYLQLAASEGRPLAAGSGDWSRLDGAFSRFELGFRKIGVIGATAQPVLVENVAEDGTWIANHDWTHREQIRSFAGQPLLYRGETLGVLGVFARSPVNPTELASLGLFADHAAVAIANARAFEQIEVLKSRLQLENAYLREEVDAAAGGLLGSSLAIQHMVRQIELVAPTNANVLILGESGTGKELVARAIHERSTRRSKPLIKVNCASIPTELFESEFFGHVKGAFTNAIRDRIGRFELSDGGSLFLDEIGEIPQHLQGKLLRVIQEGEFERVGEAIPRSVDVRIIAATNRDLPREVAAGSFRRDLYYRLSVFPIATPPLREHPEDIPLLAAHFLTQAARRLNVAVRSVDEAALSRLQEYSWPGNVRELQNVIERAAILARGGTLVFELPEAEEPRQTSPPSKRSGPGTLTRRNLRELERQSIESALEQAGGRVYGAGGAAEILGMKPTTLVSRIKALEIKRSGQ